MLGSRRSSTEGCGLGRRPSPSRGPTTPELCGPTPELAPVCDGGRHGPQTSRAAPPSTAWRTGSSASSCHYLSFSSRRRVRQRASHAVAGRRRLVCSSLRLETAQTSDNSEQMHGWSKSQKTKNSTAIKTNKPPPHVTSAKHTRVPLPGVHIRPAASRPGSQAQQKRSEGGRRGRWPGRGPRRRRSSGGRGETPLLTHGG